MDAKLPRGEKIKTGTIKHFRLDQNRNIRGTGIIEPDEQSESGEKKTLFFSGRRSVVREGNDGTLRFDLCSRSFLGEDDDRIPKVGDRIVYYESYSGHDGCHSTMCWAFLDEWEAAEQEVLERPQGPRDYRCRAIVQDESDQEQIVWEGWLHEWNEFFNLPKDSRPAFMKDTRGVVHYQTLSGWDNCMGGHPDYYPEFT